MKLAGCTAFPFHIQLSCDKSRKVHLVSLTFPLKVSQLVQIGKKEKIFNSHQIFTFWHQVLQNKTFRFRTKKYLDFAPNHFLLYRSGTKMITFVSIWHQNGNVSTPKMLCISNAFAPQFTAWCENVTIYFQNR